MRPSWPILWLAPALLALAACSSTPRAPEPAAPISGSRPADFTLAMTVYSPTRAAATGTLPRALRPARYILEPGGTLRAASGTTAPAYPPAARQLEPHQVDQLWRLLRDSPLLDPANPAQVQDPELIELSPSRTTATIYIAFGGQRRSLRLLLDRSTEDALTAERLANRLADLAVIR
jgi:hypothetical protein